MPIDPFKFCKPDNRIRYQSIPIKELDVSGKINSERDHFHGGYQVMGSISSNQICREYEITVSYDGPVDIGDRTIIKKRIPNYWSDPNIKDRAIRITGIKQGYHAGHLLATCLSVITCTYCCFINCISNSVNARDKIRDDKINELAEDQMSQVIAGIITEADEIITQRVQYKESSQQTTSNAGSVVLSAAQFQALFGALQPQHPQLPPPSTSVVSPLTIQYQDKPTIVPKTQGAQNTSPMDPPLKLAVA